MKHKHLQHRLEQLKSISQFRAPKTWQLNKYHANKYINLSGNDYLGLAGDNTLQAEFLQQYATPHAMSASSSRCLTGTTNAHTALEKQLADDYQQQASILFNSGYHANTGVFAALCEQGDLILSDELIHASLIDGIRLSKADCHRFRHNDMGHLQSLLQQYRHQYRQVWIATESLFSMDGDFAPLPKLVELKKQYDAYLYLDEAHAIGCIGKQGLGLAQAQQCIDDIDILVGTFGKALAGFGGFIVADDVLIQSLHNFSRSWIFSTALPPINVQWSHFIWKYITANNILRIKLAEYTQYAHNVLKCHRIMGSSYIVPLLISGNQAVTKASTLLEEQGILAMPIRSPTVAKGQERVRLSINAQIPEQTLHTTLKKVQYLLNDSINT